MLHPQTINFLSRYEAVNKTLLSAVLEAQDMIQEANDRGIITALPGLDFSEAGDLDHLTPEKLVASKDAIDSMVAALAAVDRAGFKGLYGVIR